MIINSITRKGERNVVVYFDNDEKLILSEDTFYNSGLRKGDEVSDDRYSFFVEQNVLYHIKQRALGYLARRFHSERELLIKLKSKSYEERLIKIVISELRKASFLDDKNFAIHFIEEKLKKKQWGKNKIRSALFNKGISGEIIDEIFLNLDSEQDEIDSALELAKKKFDKVKKRETDDRKVYQKVVAFLMSRGFDYNTSSEACNKIIKRDFE